MAGAELSFLTDVPDPFVEYATDLIDRSTGVRLVAVPASGAVDVYHGEDRQRPCRLRIPHVVRYTSATIPRLPDAVRVVDAAAASGEFPFDLFAALRFWLADEANADAPADAFDEHERLRAERSTQHLLGLREVPIVNAYLLFFRAWAEARTGVEGKSALPAGKRCVIVLSHDVDSPVDPGSPGHALGAALANVRGFRKPFRSAAYAAGTLVHAARSRVRDPGGRHRQFVEIMDAEERCGFRSTFFFAAVSRFDPEGCRLDVGYEVRRKPLPESVRAVVARGFGAGLHVGYRALADAPQMVAERARLETVAGVPVLGSRHHYWHMARPFWRSLDAHARAGLEFDSSVSFNAAPGYRLGIALPFTPWNPETRSAIPVLQVPTVAMDSMLVAETTGADEAVDRFDRLLTGLKRYEGVAALDWHEYTSLPGSKRYAAWGHAYLALLDHLASDPSVLVQTYDELLAARATDAANP